ncbi:MAG TPA: hypothetical protein PK876_02475 [Elusimicrobiota bacterium]|nr:hypothetical protein [Elusimicrobiota bacterium]
MRKKKSVPGATNNKISIPSQPASAAPAVTPKAKTKTKAAPATEQYVVIDYPMEGEIIGPCYTVRIGAYPTPKVEVSIDGKDWCACRESAGYWWFDWSGYTPGPHTVEARIYLEKRPPQKTKKRQITALF